MRNDDCKISFIWAICGAFTAMMIIGVFSIGIFDKDAIM